MKLQRGHLFSALLIVVGGYWILRREVPVGSEGFPPSFYIRGRWAVVLGAVVVAAGVTWLLLLSVV
jgi:hypothetical protein